MDIFLLLQVIVLFAAIFLGVKLGGMGIGYAGGLGVVALTLGLGLNPGQIPWDVILIIMSVIGAISAMQLAGGLDYLVKIAEKILRRNPKHINYLAPAVTYFLTIFAGTGHTAFSMIPVIVEVAKGENIKPSVPLSISVVASQIAICRCNCYEWIFRTIWLFLSNVTCYLYSNYLLRLHDHCFYHDKIHQYRFIF